ncbi:hypothetical protein AGMMS49992_25400 [Clostridia bacterium]|nr:hypothetical protein AGMMS49992_25400 [Clostridia bacterium]
MAIQARHLAEEALKLLSYSQIPYVHGGSSLNGMDCIGLVKYCAKQAGAWLNYAGSNDAFRNACSWLGTYTEAKAQGRLVPGAVGFMLEHDGQEGVKYRADGIGNASHIGVIVLSGDIHSIDASSSAGRVRTRTARDAERIWTHIGWLKELNYGMTTVTDEIGGTIMNPAAQQLRTATIVTLDGGNLNIRRDPTDKVDNRVGKAPHGTTVEVLETRGDWTRIRYSSVTGWAATRYLAFNGTAPTSAVEVTPAPPIALMPLPTGYRTITLSEQTVHELYSVLDAAMFG